MGSQHKNPIMGELGEGRGEGTGLHILLCACNPVFLSDLDNEDQGNGSCLSLLGLSSFSEVLTAYQGKGDTKMLFPNNDSKLRSGTFFRKVAHSKKKKFLPLQRALLFSFDPWERAPGGKMMPSGFKERLRQEPDSRGM